MDLQKLWTLIRSDLAKARNSLPADAASHKALAEYQNFLDHNELDLACDMLEVYAEDHKVTTVFWLALRDAAARIELPDRERRYLMHAEHL
jgi:hypothetical protein